MRETTACLALRAILGACLRVRVSSVGSEQSGDRRAVQRGSRRGAARRRLAARLAEAVDVACSADLRDGRRGCPVQRRTASASSSRCALQAGSSSVDGLGLDEEQVDVAARVAVAARDRAEERGVNGAISQARRRPQAPRSSARMPASRSTAGAARCSRLSVKSSSAGLAAVHQPVLGEPVQHAEHPAVRRPPARRATSRPVSGLSSRPAPQARCCRASGRVAVCGAANIHMDRIASIWMILYPI